MSNEKIREEFIARNLGKAICDELEQFLSVKSSYLNNEAEKTDLLLWYEILYTSLKSVWVNGGISEADFWFLTDLLGE